MKKLIFFSALLACSMAVGAEVRVDSLNRLVLDGFEREKTSRSNPAENLRSQTGNLNID
jgi:hypothetical protein